MQFNAIVFRHSHRLANGQIISHAHPYNLFNKSCPLSPNPHKTHELLLLDAISNAVFLPTFALLLAFLLLVRFMIRPVFIRLKPGIQTIALARPTLRGPPASSSFLN
ncbi:hypothetical protein BN8_p06714 (plasmid) [Fibrisoma limi BUZ 3]|uniref:Uncharacterized protein n=2 Tax=Fibrisoma limi TaxID=663275 RepID=I2GTT2_9BACT|nr:hypothetical protein BN8_p06714 [Fibrisoma limi BUZ 3]